MRKFSNQRGPSPLLNESQHVRAHLGLTQAGLAALLNVSRQALSMHEHGTRPLPLAPFGWLFKLYQALPPPGAPPAPPPPPALTATDRDDLEFRRQGLALEVWPLEQKLHRAQVRLAQARRWQQAAPALRAAFAADDARAQARLDRFEDRAADVVRTEAGSPALLQVRLAALNFEIAEITRLLATP